MDQSVKIKVALVHDFLNQYGGAERVLEVLADMFPDAPIYTLLYDPEKMRGRLKGREIRTSFLQKMPKFLRKKRGFILPFLPTAPETLDLRDFDLVISSSGAWSKGIVTRLNTIHVAYIHSPMRFVWDYNERYLREEVGGRVGFFVRPILNYLRVWDKLAADRPDHLIANSKYTQDRIRKYYSRTAKVIYPPVEIKSQIRNTKYQIPNTRYFLIVSRLSPYKKIAEAIEAFNKLELPLVIVGEGRQEKYLRRIAKNNIKFLGWLSDEKLARVYSEARAFICPGIEDFGLTMVETMSHGVPVIAIRDGGAREILVEGKTGEFFDHATPEVIADGVRRFREKEQDYDREFIKQRAEEFSKERFTRILRQYINDILQDTGMIN